MSHPTPSRQSRILVNPTTPMLDTPLQIRLVDFPPQHPLTLHMTMHDAIGTWSAHATFLTDEHGNVDLQSQEPIAGTYTGIDPMGLIWSMKLDTQTNTPAEPDHQLLPPARMTLTASVDGQQIAETTFQRLRLAPSIQRTVIRDQGLVGTLFCPIDDGPYPGILLLGGSEGGLHELDASLLAARGYAVLALAYFGMEGVPPNLVNIPLEYFETAIAFLQSHKQIRADRLGVIGGSRGGEAALLIAATFPAIRAVVSTVGSGIITQGIGEDATLLEKLRNSGPSWTYRGQPLPYLPYTISPELERQVTAGEPVELRLAFLPGLQDQASLAAATIPVERIQGAVLLISAGDDRAWPSEALSELARERLATFRHRFPYRHLVYPHAGHPIAPPPYGPDFGSLLPGPGVQFIAGGTPKATATARADAWKQTLQFFEEHLTR